MVESRAHPAPSRRLSSSAALRFRSGCFSLRSTIPRQQCAYTPSTIPRAQTHEYNLSQWPFAAPPPLLPLAPTNAVAACPKTINSAGTHSTHDATVAVPVPAPALGTPPLPRGLRTPTFPPTDSGFSWPPLLAQPTEDSDSHSGLLLDYELDGHRSEQQHLGGDATLTLPADMCDATGASTFGAVHVDCLRTPLPLGSAGAAAGMLGEEYFATNFAFGSEITTASIIAQTAAELFGDNHDLSDACATSGTSIALPHHDTADTDTTARVPEYAGSPTFDFLDSPLDASLFSAQAAMPSATPLSMPMAPMPMASIATTSAITSRPCKRRKATGATASVRSDSRLLAEASPEDLSLAAAAAEAKKQKRRKKQAVPEVQKDAAYFDYRRKNNERARKSRQKKKQQQEQERARLAALDAEGGRLRDEVDELQSSLGDLAAALAARMAAEFGADGAAMPLAVREQLDSVEVATQRANALRAERAERLAVEAAEDAQLAAAEAAEEAAAA